MGGLEAIKSRSIIFHVHLLKILSILDHFLKSFASLFLVWASCALTSSCDNTIAAKTISVRVGRMGRRFSVFAG